MIFSIAIANIKMALKQYGVHFVLFPKQSIKIEVVVLNRVLKLRVLSQTR